MAGSHTSDRDAVTPGRPSAGAPGERVRAIVRAFVLRQAEHHDTARIVNYELGALSPEHRAEIDVLRRKIQQTLVDAIVEEDVQGVAVSSYQGGHVEYFEYLAQALQQAGAGHVKIFGGGGGVIVHEEIERLKLAWLRSAIGEARAAAERGEERELSEAMIEDLLDQAGALTATR